jgi:hypothetical protein
MRPKSQSASRIARDQERNQAYGRKQATKKHNDRSPSIDDPRPDQNTSLEEQRARLEAELEPETDSGTISSLRGQTDVLDARKAENELLASKVPNSEVIYVDSDGNCFWSNLLLIKDAAGLPLESPESIMRGTAEVLRAVNIQDGQCKICRPGPAYLILSMRTRIEL